jgi:hypothetical protein
MDIYYQEAIRKQARKILTIYLNLPENTKKERSGFYLFVTNPSTVVISEPFGELTQAEVEDLFTEAMEKINRLRVKHAQSSHASGRESASPEEGLYGGAIVAGEHIFASAGLGQLGDEAISLAIAINLGLMEIQEVKRIIKISKNKLFTDLMDAIDSQKL